jgi:hypothetical protein
MNDNYLWDRSGEVDLDLQQLEEVLGTLRYQPRPLEIPASVRPSRRRSFVPAMSIAAALALLACALGFWMISSRQPATSPAESAREKRIDRKIAPLVVDAGPSKEANGSDTANAAGPTAVQRRHSKAPRRLVALKTKPDRNEEQTVSLTPAEQADKERLLTALRLVSFKLNVAQRKAQGMPALNPIRNQHRIG